MRRSGWLTVGTMCLLVASGTTSHAQSNADGNDSAGDFVRLLFAGPNWSLFAHTGVSSNGRLMLQRPTGSTVGERALRTEDGFSVGVGAGADFFLRQGFRLGYAYTIGDLAFRTDNGDGSDGLDREGGGRLNAHVLAAELIRYVLPARASVTPYGSVGFLGAWWVLEEGSPFAVSDGGSTQFRLGALASFGLQMRLRGSFSTRVEFASATVRSPFTGSESFRALGGTTIDEPTRVNKSDFRLVGVYHFGKPAAQSSTADRRSRAVR